MKRSFLAGPPHQYWSVTDVAGRVVALCPDIEMAQRIAKLLEQNERKSADMKSAAKEAK